MGNDWSEAQGHAEALVRLVESRGGMQVLDFELQRTVTWCVRDGTEVTSALLT